MDRQRPEQSPSMRVIRSREDLKRQQEEEEIRHLHFRAMIEQQMTSKPGRDFVRWLLYDVLQHDKKNASTNSFVYRMSERQNAALDVKDAIETYCPALWDQLIAEKRQDGK